MIGIVEQCDKDAHGREVHFMNFEQVQRELTHRAGEHKCTRNGKKESNIRACMSSVFSTV